MDDLSLLSFRGIGRVPLKPGVSPIFRYIKDFGEVKMYETAKRSLSLKDPNLFCKATCAPTFESVWGHVPPCPPAPFSYALESLPPESLIGSPIGGSRHVWKRGGDAASYDNFSTIRPGSKGGGGMET